MQNLNKGKETISQKITKIKQSRVETKTDQSKPISNYRRTNLNDNSTTATYFNQSNSLINKTNSYSGNKVNDYKSSIGRRNEGYQVVNNYSVVNKDEKKTTDSKDIDHKKWGIRKRGWEATPLLPLNNTEDKISIRRDDNSKLISNTSSNQINKYSTNFSNNPKSTNSYISGSSQSNYIYQRSYGTDNKNDKINISSNTKNISNSNQLRSPIIKHNYSSQKTPSSVSSNVTKNNTTTTIHSIVDKKNIPKPFTLNERKNEVIKSERRNKLRFTSKEGKPITNTKNHSIVFSRTDNTSNSGNNRSKYNSNVTNTEIHSINESRKTPIPRNEIVVSPRKNIVIQMVRSHKRINNSSQPNNVSYNINLRNQNNIVESKYTQNKYESSNG